MLPLRNSLQIALIALVLSFLIPSAGFCGICAQGAYTGVVIFDRWGGCHLYSGAYLMEVSESVKGGLRPFAGKAIRFLGIESSPAFVRQPEGNGCIERFFRTLKEQLLSVRHFQDVEELQAAVREFRDRYNRE